MPTYRLGEMVRIKSGPFINFLGKIEGINQAKSLLKIAVEILSNPRVVLKSSDVEKYRDPDEIVDATAVSTNSFIRPV